LSVGFSRLPSSGIPRGNDRTINPDVSTLVRLRRDLAGYTVSTPAYIKIAHRSFRERFDRFHATRILGREEKIGHQKRENSQVNTFSMEQRKHFHIIGVAMMCLWRLATLSRLIVLHSVATSTLQLPVVRAHTPYYDNSRNPNRRRYDESHFNAHYISLGRLSFPQSSSLWSSLIQDSIQDLCARLVKSTTFLLQRRRTFLQVSCHGLSTDPTCCKFQSSSSFFQEAPQAPTEIIPQCSDDIVEFSDVSSTAFDDLENVPNENEYASMWKASLNQVWPSVEDPLRPQRNAYDVATADLSHGIVADSDSNTIHTVQEVIRIKRQSQRKAFTAESETDSTGTSTEELQQRYIESLTQPLMTERVWNQLTGTEWGATTSEEEASNDPLLKARLLNALTKMGEEVARVDAPTDWIDWRVYGDSKPSSPSPALIDGAIQVWLGKCHSSPPPKNPTEEDDRYMGLQLPFIKTRAILPYPISEVVDLLLDSSRVVLYNPWSLGRKDCWIDNSSSSSEQTRSKMTTKIVQNRVQPPIPGARPVVSTTLLHARPLLHNSHSASNASSKKSSSERSDDSNDTSWIIVSRSIGNKHIYLDPSDSNASSRSDVLLGVNLLEPVRGSDGTIDPHSCILTAVTHVYSPSLPLVLAERLGVQSAIKFVQDLRSVKAATTAPSSVPATAVAVRQVSMKAD
jgi:hypothetical protein